MKSDEPITPKASQRVIDGEVVEENQADVKNEKAEKTDKATKSNTAKQSKSSSQWLPQTFMQKMVLVLLLGVLGLGGYWVWQTSQQDWQIEHINQLQLQQKNLKASTQTLQDRLDKQAQQLAELRSASQTPAFSQADLDQIKTDMTQVEAQLKEQVAGLSESLSSLSERIVKSSEDAIKQVIPSDQQQQEVQQTVDAMTSKFNQELSGIKQQLGELFDFKSEQTVETETDKSAEQPTATPVLVLTEAQLRQWTVQINTQWLLGADASQIRQQLNALEQAAASSDWQQKHVLLRQIGEDMAQLNQAQSQNSQAQQVKKTLEQLTHEIGALTKMAEPIKPALKQPDASESPAQPASAWQQLLQKIQALFSIQKRTSEQQLSQVQQLIERDVLIQRALLQVERMGWALEMGSKTQLKSAKQGLGKLMAQYFDQNKVIPELLAQIDENSLSTRQPLKIAGAS